LIHEKKLNNLRYRSDNDDTKNLHYRLDVGSQYPQKAVCMNAFRNALAIYRRPWEKLKKSISSGNYTAGPIAHGNVGTHHRHESSNQRKCQDSVKCYLQELADTCGDAYATRFIREKTAVGLRNDEINSIELPSNMTYRNIYCGWCYSMGYKPRADAKGNFGPVTDFPLRSFDDITWPAGSQGNVCSWSSFRKLWTTFFPSMKIRNRCEDVCGECVRLKNSFQFLKKQQREKQQKIIEGSDNCDDASHSSTGSKSSLVSDTNVSLDVADDTALVEELEDQEFPEEYLWFRANEHASKAQAQRQLVRQRERESKETRELPHEERSYCLVADYCQNLSIPYFGGEQPGDTYYFSPLFVYVFGMADVAKDRAELLAYGYHEGEGSKGGNNVASLLMQALKELGWLMEDRVGGRLTIVMDNCGGQNKNRMVLRLALYLVEQKYFSTVEFIFYIRGHTKNVCDRLFNLLKIRYHKSNIYTMDMLVDVLNSTDDVTFIHASDSFFYDYDSMLNEFYKNFPSGTIQKNHYFSVHCDAPTTMITKAYINDPTETLVDFKKKNDRQSALKNYPLQRLLTPGIRDIKQVELWKNWRQFVPDPHKDLICPKPPEEVIQKIRKEKSEKQQQRTNERKKEKSEKQKQQTNERKKKKSEKQKLQTKKRKRGPAVPKNKKKVAV